MASSFWWAGGTLILTPLLEHLAAAIGSIMYGNSNLPLSMSPCAPHFFGACCLDVRTCFFAN